MNQIWTQLKRWGWPWVTRIGLALPLLLGLGALLMLVAIWWLGPQWTWREQQPLASVAHRSVASLVLVLVPLLCWLGVLRTRFRRLQAERRQALAAEQDVALPFVQAQERALSQGLERYLDNAGGRRALYRLPWYLVLGDEQSGKSSFIDRTDQRFTLTRIDQAQARGRQTQAMAYPVGWWVSDDAVIIDPPGVFISQKPPVGSAANAPSEASAPPGIRPGYGSTCWAGCSVSEASGRSMECCWWSTCRRCCMAGPSSASRWPMGCAHACTK